MGGETPHFLFYGTNRLKLSEAPLTTIKIGDTVKTSNGKIGKIISIQKALWDEDDNQIEILWANNVSTLEYHYMYNEVEI
jgi:preprotein translocase subunit YajC